MAQAVDHYDSTLAYRGYIYDERSLSAGRTQYEPGTALWIYANADGTVKLLDGFYHCTLGWVPTDICNTPTPSYVTVADRCTQPSGVTLNVKTKVLTVTGGAGGALNAFTGYKAQYRQAAEKASLDELSAFGAWTDLATLTGGVKTLSVSAPVGYARQFRVCATGAAGASYYSAYVECATVLYGNAAPGAPTISRPVSGAEAAVSAPSIVLLCPAEPDGDTQTLERRLDGGAWTSAIASAAGTVYDLLPTLSAGAHTVSYRLRDAHGLAGGTASVSFTVRPMRWARKIEPGTVISSPSVSHRADITELLNAVNASRAFYGLSAIALPGALGAFSGWKAQMEAPRAGEDQARAAAGRLAAEASAVPAYPTAAVIAALRAGLA